MLAVENRTTACNTLTIREMNYVNPAQCVHVRSHHRLPAPAARRADDDGVFLATSRYDRILKRRTERAIRETMRPTLPRAKVRPHSSPPVHRTAPANVPHRACCCIPHALLRQYLHESRHEHAINRVRGEKGRFLQGPDSDVSSEGVSPDSSPKGKPSGPVRLQHADHLHRMSPLVSNPPRMRYSSHSDEQGEHARQGGRTGCNQPLAPDPTKELHVNRRRAGADYSEADFGALTATPSTGSAMRIDSETGNLANLMMATPSFELPLELFDELMF